MIKIGFDLHLRNRVWIRGEVVPDLAKPDFDKRHFLAILVFFFNPLNGTERAELAMSVLLSVADHDSFVVVLRHLVLTERKQI